MLRRLCVLLLVLACTLAPALPAFETAAKSDDCGCGRSCCGANDCAQPPAPAQATTTLSIAGAVEARATIIRPVLRATSIFPLSRREISTVTSGRAPSALRVVDVVASAPLRRLHCTFLI